MKLLKHILPAFVFSIALGLTGCKNKSSQDTVKPSVDTNTKTTTPVQIETDDVLKNGVRDATKDYPGVTASVNAGEITLIGEITRDNLTKLMQALHGLHPKKINNNLTIK